MRVIKAIDRNNEPAIFRYIAGGATPDFADDLSTKMDFEAAFAHLNDKQKVVIGLRLEGFLDKDIAKVTGVSPQAVGHMKRRAIGILAHYMDNTTFVS